MTGPAVFFGLVLSLGSGRPVTARATFDPKVAAQGGRVLILDSASAADDSAIRMAEAVVVRRGGLASRAGQAARRHGVPAVALGQGRFDASIPALRLEEPLFGAPGEASGSSYRPFSGTAERIVREGDAVVVDAALGRVSLVPPEEADDRVGAAEAALTFDGLRDEQSLENWLGEASPARAAALLEELVPRAASGAMRPDDLLSVRRKAESSVPASARESLRRVENAAFARAAKSAKRRAEDCGSSDEARVQADAVSAVARILSQPDLGAAAALRACAAAAAKREKSRGAGRSLAEAAAEGGADAPDATALSDGLWRRFVDDNGLSEWLSRTVDDASLGLRRKSERIRERVLAGRLSPVAEASGPVLVVGEDAALKADGPSDAAARLKEVWAASWGPGPLGARLRAGRALAFDGKARVEKLTKSDAAGVLFSRDPGSGRRERVLVEASAAPLEAVLSGDAETSSYALDRATGRAVAPKTGSGADLSPERLERLAKAARALDAWKGAGVEAAFSFSGDKLFIHHARAIEAPKPITPLNDPFAPRVEADQSLNVRGVR